MAAYYVEIRADGEAAWFAPWMMVPFYQSPHKVRPATAEEQELMDKVVWKTDTPDDVKRLRALIRRENP